MKKVLIVLIAMSLNLVLFSACGATTKASDHKEKQTTETTEGAFQQGVKSVE